MNHPLVFAVLDDIKKKLGAISYGADFSQFGKGLYVTMRWRDGFEHSVPLPTSEIYMHPANTISATVEQFTHARLAALGSSQPERSATATDAEFPLPAMPAEGLAA